jgi:hypothetical protein
MNNDLVPHTNGVITQIGAEDPFEIMVAPAKPVLDAVVETWRSLTWLDQRRRSRRPLFEADMASDLIAIIPDGGRLAAAGALFLGAVDTPAPESWVHIAIAVMQKSEAGSNAVDSDAFRCAIADGAYRDPQVWGQYEPGFSFAVIVGAIRQARLQGALPSPGGFLQLCIKQRAQFRKWNADISTLMNIRYEAEDVLEANDTPVLLEYDGDSDVPF